MRDEDAFAACAGTEGPFAVNIWFKLNITDNSGDLFAYILSTLNNATQSVSGGSNVYAPNSLQLMLPEVCDFVALYRSKLTLYLAGTSCPTECIYQQHDHANQQPSQLWLSMQVPSLLHHHCCATSEWQQQISGCEVCCQRLQRSQCEFNSRLGRKLL